MERGDEKKSSSPTGGADSVSIAISWRGSRAETDAAFNPDINLRQEEVGMGMLVVVMVEEEE